MLFSLLLTLLLATLSVMSARRERWGLMVLFTCGGILSFGAFAIYVLGAHGNY